jgi:hypothetical protein
METMMTNWPFSAQPGARPPPAPPDYDKAREKHGGEIKNFAMQWNIPWPPQDTFGGPLSAHEILEIHQILASYPDHERHRTDCSRFPFLLNICGYTNRKD